mmetsp:Transcript_3743/g.4184  ORF Transcript_3743/g.4184 Transcript_3743/m.4184 type:complete len:155 (+) Transcript_3743:1-465(+)
MKTLTSLDAAADTGCVVDADTSSVGADQAVNDVGVEQRSDLPLGHCVPQAVPGVEQFVGEEKKQEQENGRQESNTCMAETSTSEFAHAQIEGNISAGCFDGKPLANGSGLLSETTVEAAEVADTASEAMKSMSADAHYFAGGEPTGVNVPGAPE